MKKTYILAILLILVLLLTACKPAEIKGKVIVETTPKNEETFTVLNNEICTQDGKPIIRKFSTTWCPHCIWIKETYDKVAQEYVKENKIIAYSWEVDTGDNTLTKEIETAVPKSEMDVFKKINPQESIPTFIFGCKYIRFGNGYEGRGDLASEEKEFRDIIDELITKTN